MLAILTLGFVLASPFELKADEPVFGYVYLTDLQPKGKWELEQWLTDREGQAHGYFHHLDMRTEVEYGVTDKFQLSVYANYLWANESGNSVRGLTEGIEIPADHDPNQPYNQLRFEGFSLEAIYRFLSPYVDPVGLAAYIEPEFGPYANGLEARVILQKNFLEDQLILAANGWVELDKENGSNLVPPGSTEVPDGSVTQNTYLEFDLGASYRFASHWSAGFEFRDHNEYSGFTLNGSAQAHGAVFLGPNVHYGSEHYFFTIAVLRQMAVATYTDDQRAQTYNGLLYGDEHTTWDGIRVKVGFPF